MLRASKRRYGVPVFVQIPLWVYKFGVSLYPVFLTGRHTGYFPYLVRRARQCLRYLGKVHGVRAVQDVVTLGYRYFLFQLRCVEGVVTYHLLVVKRFIVYAHRVQLYVTFRRSYYYILRCRLLPCCGIIVNHSHDNAINVDIGYIAVAFLCAVD